MGKKSGRPPTWKRRQLIDGIRWRCACRKPHPPWWEPVCRIYGGLEQQRLTGVLSSGC
ncbi:hypothetical protein ACWD6R_32580 [Streptomyces sp. NPDC005151]